MKELLTLLGSISLIGGSPAITFYGQLNSTCTTQTQYPLDSLKNIIKIINSQNEEKNLNNEEIDDLLDDVTPSFYKSIVTKENWTKGKILTTNSSPRDDLTVIKNYTNKYVNNGPLKQTRLTQEYKEEISETSSYVIEVQDRMVSSINQSISMKLEIPFTGDMEEGVDITIQHEEGKLETRSQTKSRTVTETAPAQSIEQNPYTTLYVDYTITQSNVDYQGVARFEIINLKNTYLNMPIFYFDNDGHVDYLVWEHYSIDDILTILYKSGYKEQVITQDTDRKDYSIISVENINNPTKAFLNLPIEWSSPSSGIVVENYEEPLEV